MDRFEDKKWNEARRVLWKHACGPMIQHGHNIYQLLRGMPSGHPATSVVNSLYNSTLFTLAFTSCASKGTDAAPFGEGWHVYPHLFPQYVRLAVLGDDNLFSSTWEGFDEIALPSLMARFGAKYTLDVKTGAAAVPLRRLEEVTFMGRHFRFDKGRLLPALRKSSLSEMGQYALSERVLTQQWYADVAYVVLLEAAMWEQDYFDQHRAALVAALKAHVPEVDFGCLSSGTQDEWVQLALQHDPRASSEYIELD